MPNPSLHGLLIIDKPAHWTSHDVVAWARKWTGERKIGHAGTLDPAATGVLPLALNDGTKVLEFLAEADKAYRAEITFGVATDSGDIEGTVIATGISIVDEQLLESALQSFIGQIEQIPPALSAIRIDGRRAYDLVRAGESVDMPVRSVGIESINLIERTETTVTIDVSCSKGTYIRSLARDLGERLGTVAYLSNLIRTRSGPFTLDDAWTIAELRELDPVASWSEIAMHPDEAIPDWPAVVVDDAAETFWMHGRGLDADIPSDSRCRVFNEIGEWIGLAEYNPIDMTWRPLRVIGQS